MTAAQLLFVLDLALGILLLALLFAITTHNKAMSRQARALEHIGDALNRMRR